MPFLTKGPTNWKFIFIVVVLAIISAIIILSYYQLTIKELEAPPPMAIPEKVIEDETADWLTYNNEKYKYSFRYPAGASIYTASPEDFYEEENYQKYTGEICIKVAYNRAVLYINAPENKDNDYYANCRLRHWLATKGKPARDISESVTVEGKNYIAEGKEVTFGDSDLAEIFELKLENGLIFTYGTDIRIINEKLTQQNFHGYLEDKPVIHQILSTFRFLESETDKKLFPGREDIMWEEYRCSEREELAKEKTLLYEALIGGDGPIEKNCQMVLEAEDCNDTYIIHKSINIGYFDLTNNGRDEAIVVYKGGMLFRANIVGVFMVKDGRYLKILDEGLWEKDPYPKLEDNYLVITEPIYTAGDARCCPSNKAHIYYQFTEEGPEIHKIIDNYGYNITDTYR